MSVIPVNPTPVVNQSRIALEIEALVIRIMQASALLDPRYAVYQAPNSLPWTLYRDVAVAAPGFMSIYQPELFEYSEHLEAFFYGCESTGIADLWRQQGFMGLHNVSQLQWQYLVNAIVAYTRTGPFKRRLYDRQYETGQYCDGLMYNTDGAAENYARLLSVRFDCYYLKQYQDAITVHEAFEHLRRFSHQINHRRGVFRHLASYCRVVEQAPDTGFHIHFGFLFKGHCHQNAYPLAMAMRALWLEITDGKGYCYSSNAKENTFEKAGINGLGMLKRDDPEKRERMLGVMQYMAKLKTEPQHLRIKPKRARVFAKAQFPD